MAKDRSSKILKHLLKERRLFVAIYTPVEETATIDFTTGTVPKKWDISYAEGAVVFRDELKSFARRSSAAELVVVSSKVRHLLIENPKVQLTLKSKIILHGGVHSISHVHDSSYGGWATVDIEYLSLDTLFEPEVLLFNCADQHKVYLDKLARDIRTHYSGAVPVGVEVWPIVGFATADSLRMLYPVDGTTSYSPTGEYVEVGRRSGYGLDLIAGLVQTNTPALQPYIDEFNTSLGRL